MKEVLFLGLEILFLDRVFIGWLLWIRGGDRARYVRDQVMVDLVVEERWRKSVFGLNLVSSEWGSL